MAIQEPTFFILTALVRTALHGYGIMQAVEQLSEGRLTLRAGASCWPFPGAIEAERT